MVSKKIRECYLALRVIFPEWGASHALKTTHKAVAMSEGRLTTRAADGWQMPNEQELWKAVEFARKKTGYYTRRR